MPPLLLPLLLAALGLAGCSNAPEATDYFPLQSGLRWQYEVTERNPVSDVRTTLSIRNLDGIVVDDRRYARRLASDGNEYWLEVFDGRLLRSGVRTAIDRAPKMDATPHTILQLPPAAGQWWEVETRPYILERVEPFRERFWHDDSKRVQLKMTVAATDAVVEVPAGRFENCLRLEGHGVLNVLADARIGASEVPVSQTEWYAPGVGLVQLVRSEELKTQQIVGGEIRMRLRAFSH